MSWKNLASVAVCALLASPALALPSLQIESGGLDGNGDWVWNVSVTPEASFFVDNPPNGVGGSIAVELGLTASGGSNLIGATTTANIENENPGNHIFGWEVEEDTDPGAGVNMQPVGLQIGTGGDSNEIFAALGTTYFTSGGAKHILTITTEGPSTAGSLTSSIDLSPLSIIAQNDPSTTDDTSDFAAGSASRTVKAADADLSGTVDGLDLLIMADNFGATSGRHWGTADFDGTGGVDGLDLLVMADNFGQSGGSNSPLNSVPSGGGAGAGAAVPEPASIALAGLALLAGLGLVRRK